MDNRTSTQQIQAQLKQTTLQRERVYTTSEYIAERDRQIKKIENDMVEVNELVGEVSSLVKEQGDLIDNILENAEKANSNSAIALKNIKEAKTKQEFTTCRIL